jgi:hypothetical protein
VQSAAHNRLVDVNIAIPDFQVKAAVRVGANPGLVMNVRALAAEIGQGYKITNLTFLTFRETGLFHRGHLPTLI